jgi:uncharacterized membrane protein
MSFSRLKSIFHLLMIKLGIVISLFGSRGTDTPCGGPDHVIQRDNCPSKISMTEDPSYDTAWIISLLLFLGIACGLFAASLSQVWGRQIGGTYGLNTDLALFPRSGNSFLNTNSLIGLGSSTPGSRLTGMGRGISPLTRTGRADTNLHQDSSQYPRTNVVPGLSALNLLLTNGSNKDSGAGWNGLCQAPSWVLALRSGVKRTLGIELSVPLWMGDWRLLTCRPPPIESLPG